MCTCLESYFDSSTITRASLARKCDVTPEYVTQLTKGIRRPSPELAARISAATGGQVTVKDLLYPNGFPAGAVFEAADAAA